MRRTIPAILATLMLLGAASGATAQEDRPERDEPEEDQRWRDEPRTLNVEHSRQEVRFISERSSELGDDLLEIRYGRDTGRLEYRFTSFDAAGDGVRLIHDVRLVALVEFHDHDEDRWGLNAQPVERYGLQELDTRPLALEPVLQGNGYRATIEYLVPDRREHDEDPLLGVPSLDDGVLRIEFLIVENPQRIQGEPLSPTQLLMDIQIEGHPYTKPDTRLALETTLTGTRIQSLTGDETGFTQRAGMLQSLIEWSPTAMHDGSQRDVATTVLSFPEGDEDTQILLMTAYGRAQDITHPWTFTTTRFTELPDEIIDLFTRGNVAVFATAALATLAAAGWPVMRRLRET